MSGSVSMVNPLDVMRRSLRFDLIFKVELAHAWGEGDSGKIRRAEEAYLEMVRARNCFYERMPLKRTPKDFIEAFRAVANSIRQWGYDPHADPIPLDVNGDIVNGAHRLSACIAYGKSCPVVTAERMYSGGSNYEAFLEGNIHPAVAHWGMDAYLRLLPDGPLAPMCTGTSADESFPDWEERANAMKSFHIMDWLRLFRYRLVANFTWGRRREKSLSHAEEAKCRMKSYRALAEYWKGREM